MAWEQLVDIAREATTRAREDAVPVACPHDGEPLRDGPRGEKYCPYDGYRA